MFEQSIVARPAKTRRVCTVAVSFCLQGLAVGTGILIPLVFTEGIPMARLAPFRIEVPRSRPVKPQESQDHVKLVPTGSPIRAAKFVAPTFIRKGVPDIKDPPELSKTTQTASIDPCPWCPHIDDPNLPDARPSDPRMPRYEPKTESPKRETVATPKAQEKPVPRIRIASLDPARLVSKVVPVYPPLARQIRVSGTVVLRALIGTDGSIRELHLVSGHPLLAQAAIDAVRQWRYRPTILNGDPFEVETTIDVNFILSN